LHRQAVAALAAELADLRKFVSANVLNADEASRVAAKLSKAEEKFRAVEASGESLILAFEADSKPEQGEGTVGGCAVPSESIMGSGLPADTIGGLGTGSIHDEATTESNGPPTTIARETEIVGSGDVGTLPESVVQGSDAPAAAESVPAEPPATEAPAPEGSSPAGNSEDGSATTG